MDGDSSLPIALRRCKRQKKAVNYKEEDFVKLPKAEKVKKEAKLYPVTVTQEKSEGDRAMVKIHYEGYSNDCDEWRCEEELECLEEEMEHSTLYQPYSVYSALRVKVKLALNCGRKVSPTIKISMPFDLIEFNGGLKAVGVLSKTVHGVQHYKINHYQDLNHLLGSCWHFRGLNVNGDYGYVLLDTVDFSLRKARSLVEYFPPISDNQSPAKTYTETGHTLSFCFVCQYGNGTTFGKDKTIFECVANDWHTHGAGGE